LTLAGTDSRRLSVRTIPAVTLGTFAEPAKQLAIVHTTFVKQLFACLDRIPDTSRISFASTANEFAIECDSGFAIRGNLCAGRFPKYRDIVPQTGTATVSCNRKQLLSVIVSASAVTDKESRGMHFVFPVSGSGSAFDTAEVQAESSALGKSRVPFPFRFSRGDSFGSVKSGTCVDGFFAMTLDPKFVLQFLTQSVSEFIDCRIVDCDTAVVFSDTGDSDGVYVVMPLSADR